MEYAQWYAKGPPLAIGTARALVYQGDKQDFREHLDAIYWAVSGCNPDRTEAMAAWVEKREPHYKGEGINI
jgi:enoyl-CoA hydratase/carnithine racemase